MNLRNWLAPVALGLAGLAAGCNSDNVVAAAAPRAFNQIQRLGNPLVSEVFLAKRSHPVHGSTGPVQSSIGRLVRSKIRTSVPPIVRARVTEIILVILTHQAGIGNLRHAACPPR